MVVCRNHFVKEDYIPSKYIKYWPKILTINLELINMIKQTLDLHAKRVSLKRGAVPSINLPKRRFDKVLTPKQMEMIANKAIRVERREALKTKVYNYI